MLYGILMQLFSKKEYNAKVDCCAYYKRNAVPDSYLFLGMCAFLCSPKKYWGSILSSLCPSVYPFVCPSSYIRNLSSEIDVDNKCFLETRARGPRSLKVIWKVQGHLKSIFKRIEIQHFFIYLSKVLT
jgi:hypothetical protein